MPDRRGKQSSVDSVDPVSSIPSPQSTFGSRLRYKFDNALSRGPSVVIGWLGFITLAIIVLVGLVVAFAEVGGVGGADKSKGVV